MNEDKSQENDVFSSPSEHASDPDQDGATGAVIIPVPAAPSYTETLLVEPLITAQALDVTISSRNNLIII